MPVTVVNHPLVRHKLGILRQHGLDTKQFRDLTSEIARLLTYEATKDLVTEPVTINGWAGPVTVDRIAGKMITVVPILRAGLGMMDGVLDMVPGAKVSVVGFYRDEETLNPVRYYVKLGEKDPQAPGADPRSHAGHRRHSDRHHQPAQGGRLPPHPGAVPGVRSRGTGPAGARTSGRGGLHRGHRRAPQRARLHPARPRRCRGTRSSAPNSRKAPPRRCP